VAPTPDRAGVARAPTFTNSWAREHHH